MPPKIIDVAPRFGMLNDMIDAGGGGETAEWGRCLLMVNVRVAVPVPLLLAALNVTVDVPAAAGVPEINPVAVFTDKPAGKPLAP